MFKRSIRLFNESQFSKKQDKHQKILDYFTPNDNIVEKADQVPYEIRGEYLPKRKINPYRKRPMNVTYHHHDYASFVLPSRRNQVFGTWGVEQLFGVKRWRNDSPFMKEYIRVDNQILLIFIALCILMYPVFWHRHHTLVDSWENYNLSQYGKFTANDLI